MRNQLLRDTDWASMAHSLEVRVPLVDRMLLETLAPLLVAPDRAPGKTWLARAPRPGLPKVVHRPKTGFLTPINEWLRRSRTCGRLQAAQTYQFRRIGRVAGRLPFSRSSSLMAPIWWLRPKMRGDAGDVARGGAGRVLISTISPESGGIPTNLRFISRTLRSRGYGADSRHLRTLLTLASPVGAELSTTAPRGRKRQGMLSIAVRRMPSVPGCLSSNSPTISPLRLGSV